MKIARLVFNPIQENTYIVWDDTLQAAIIDAGNMGERENEILDKFIADRGLRPVLAINTHGHFDHLLGVNHLVLVSKFKQDKADSVTTWWSVMACSSLSRQRTSSF